MEVTEQPKVRVPWRVIMLTNAAAVLPSGDVFRSEAIPTEREPVVVTFQTRYADVGHPQSLPHELIITVDLLAEDAEVALREAGSIGSGISAMLSFAVNAFVATPAPHVAFESAVGLERRSFWQRQAQLREPTTLTPSRLLDKELLYAFMSSVFASSEASRLIRAISQYQVALSHWSTSGKPLALAHLYMALEALGPVALRRQLARTGLEEKAYAESIGVNVARGNWKEVMLGWVRRDGLCEKDRTTYDAARKASDGFEHASMDLPTYRAAANEHAPALLGYVRRGILDLLRVPEEQRKALAEKGPIDISPLWHVVTGELFGDVADPDALARNGDPYLAADWTVSFEAVERLEDGRVRPSSRMNLELRHADGVEITWLGFEMWVGLNDPDKFDHEPPASD